MLVSYCEWVQNLQEFPWERDTVPQRLEQRPGRVYKQVRDHLRQRRTDLRTAAFELPIGRVSRAMALRGFRVEQGDTEVYRILAANRNGCIKTLPATRRDLYVENDLLNQQGGS